MKHPPFFTVEEGRPWHDKIPGLHCKNLFINDTQRRATVILGEEMLESEWVNLHPLHNADSSTLRSANLLRFVRALGDEPIVRRLPEVPADNKLC
jgi:hypothetical protein